MTAEPDKTDGVLTPCMDGWMAEEGRKESEMDGVEAGTGRRCINWQEVQKMEKRDVWDLTRCLGLVEKEGLMGCGLMAKVSGPTGLRWSNDNLWFLKCFLKPQRGLRNGTWQDLDCSITNRGPGGDPQGPKREMFLNHIPPSLLWHHSGNQDFYMQGCNAGVFLETEPMMVEGGKLPAVRRNTRLVKVLRCTSDLTVFGTHYAK